MSKTDKDRPYYIRAFFEGDLEHDHIDGECRPASLGEGSRRWHWNHNCTKYETIEYECPGFNYAQRNVYGVHGGPAKTCYAQRRFFSAEWGAVERGDYSASRLLAIRWRKSRFCGETHTYRKFHRDWACEECDTRPTCYYSLGWRERPYRHVPKWYVNRQFRRPERRRVKNQLDGIRRTFNYDPDFQIFDETEPEAEQHRHRAAWHWY